MSTLKPTQHEMTITRRQRREWAIQMLAGADLNPPDDLDSFLEDCWQAIATLDPAEGGASVNGRNRAFTEERVRGVLSNKDGELVPLIDKWEIDRLGTIERAVLRMGIWEMMYSDTPHAVVINEAIDLSNWFSGPKSRSLVNGVLDRFSKSANPRPPSGADAPSGR